MSSRHRLKVEEWQKQMKVEMMRRRYVQVGDDIGMRRIVELGSVDEDEAVPIQ